MPRSPLLRASGSRPAGYGFARKRGLQDCDAADLTQDVLRAVAATAGRFHYDSRRGTFRGWLFTVARHKLSTQAARQKRQCQGSGDSDAQLRLEELPAPEPDKEAQWEQEHERQMLACAIEQVRGDFQDSTCGTRTKETKCEVSPDIRVA